MSIAQAMLGEFEYEAATTRKFLDRVPPDKLMWRPHQKSHTTGELALHIAMLPEFVTRFALVDSSPLPDPAMLFKQPTAVAEILDAYEKTVEAVRKILPTFEDDYLMTNWSAMLDGKPVVTVPKATVLRIFMMNHWLQHRGQLCVHLRLLGARIPSSYGPSGDEG